MARHLVQGRYEYDYFPYTLIFVLLLVGGTIIVSFDFFERASGRNGLVLALDITCARRCFHVAMASLG